MSPTEDWRPDPTGRHEERAFSGKRPTDIVRDGGRESLDPMPPSGPGRRRFLLVIGGVVIAALLAAGIASGLSSNSPHAASRSATVPVTVNTTPTTIITNVTTTSTTPTTPTTLPPAPSATTSTAAVPQTSPPVQQPPDTTPFSIDTTPSTEVIPVATPTTAPLIIKHTITYEVCSCGVASIIYLDSDLGHFSSWSNQQTQGGWRFSVSLSTGSNFSMTTCNDYRSWGDLTCTVREDGTFVTSRSVSLQNATTPVTCDGTVK